MVSLLNLLDFSIRIGELLRIRRVKDMLCPLDEECAIDEDGRLAVQIGLYSRITTSGSVTAPLFFVAKNLKKYVDSY